MELTHIYSIVVSIFTVITGGGWFINYRQKKQVEKANAGLKELELKEASLNYYLKRILDLEDRLLKAEHTIDELKDLVNVLKKK